MKRSVSLIVIGLLIIVGVYFWGMDAEAATVTVTWTNPTQRTDNSPLAPADIGGTFVEWGTCSGSAFGALVGSQETTGAVTSMTVTNITPATLCFRAFTKTVTGLSSAPSAVVIKVVNPPAEVPPKPPALSVITQTAYVLKPSFWGLIRLAKVDGVTLQVGAACEALVPGLTGYGVAGQYLARCG